MSGENDDILLRAALRDELTGPLKDITSELNRVQSGMDKLAGKADKASAAGERQAHSAGTQRTALQKLHAQLTSTDNAIGKLGKRTSGMVDGAGAKLFRWAKYGAAGLFALGARSAFQFASSVEQASASLTNLLGSSSAANALIAQLKTFATKTPFNFDSLVSSAQQLVAIGISADRVIPTMQSLGDATSALGGGNDLLARMIKNLGQINAAGKVSTRDMNDFATAGLPIWDLMSKKLGITTAQLRDMIGTAGGGQEVFRRLGGTQGITDLIGSRFTGAMDAQSKTFKGVLSNFSDAFNNAMLPLATRALGGATTVLKSLGDWMASPQGQKAIDDLSATLVAMWPTVASVGRGFGWMAVNGLRLMKALQPFTPVLVGVAGGLAALLVMYKVAAAIKFVTGAWALLNSTFALSPIGMIIIGIAALAAGLIYAYKHSETFRNTVHGAMVLARMGVDAVVSSAKSLWAWFGKLADKARDLGKNRFVRWGMSAASAVGNVGGAVAGAFGDTAVPHRGTPRGFDRHHSSRTLGMLSAAAAMTPGHQVLTSHVRTWGIGANSDHLTGRAGDVAGSNLGAFARNVESLGGHAEFHGSGSGRHVHAVGDRSVPWRGTSSPNGGAATIEVTQVFQAPVTSDDAYRIERATRRGIASAQRDAAERS